MLCGWRGALPPPQSCHPGPPWDGISSDNSLRANLPQQPSPLGLQQLGRRPSPRPLPSALWLCSGRCREHCPRAPCRPSSSSQGPSGHRRALSLRHSWAHPCCLPCPHTQSLSSRLTLLCIHRRAHPPPSPVSVTDPKVAETVTRVKVPTCPDDGRWDLSSSCEASRPTAWPPHPSLLPRPRPSRTCGQAICLRVPILLRAGTVHVLPKRLNLGPRPPSPVGGLAPNFTGPPNGQLPCGASG